MRVLLPSYYNSTIYNNYYRRTHIFVLFLNKLPPVPLVSVSSVSPFFPSTTYLELFFDLVLLLLDNIPPNVDTCAVALFDSAPGASSG